jgi:hypothetical protein
MEELSASQVARHLQILSADLRLMQPDAYFPWPLARVFNELLKETKFHLDGHPVIATVSTVKPHPNDEQFPDVANITITTAAALVSHMHAALEMTYGMAYEAT